MSLRGGAAAAADNNKPSSSSGIAAFEMRSLQLHSRYSTVIGMILLLLIMMIASSFNYCCLFLQMKSLQLSSLMLVDRCCC
jgi:hypothetical protein